MPKLYPAQRAAIFHDARYVVIEASTKAGKTIGCIVWQAEKVLTIPGEHWWVAPVQRQADIAFRRAHKMLRPLCQAHLTHRTLTFPNGAVWRFSGSEKPDNLYGEDVWSAVIDEASRCREDSIDAVRSTLTKTRAPMRLIGNVRGRTNRHYRMARAAEQGADDMHYAMLTCWDAVEGGVLDRAEIEDAKAVLPDHVFRELYECVPSDDGGNPFGLDVIDRQIQATLTDLRPVCWGLDPAKKRDWLVLKALDKNGRWCQRHRWKRKDWEISCDLIADLVGGARVVVDATGLGDVVCDMLARRGVAVERYVFSNASKQALFESLEVELRAGRAHVLSDAMGEYFTFEYVERDGRVYYGASTQTVDGETPHDDEVCADALAWVQGRRLGLGRSDWQQPTATTNLREPWLRELN